MEINGLDMRAPMHSRRKYLFWDSTNMKRFLKYFCIALVIQLVVIGMYALFGVGEFLLIPYWLPYQLLVLLTNPGRLIDWVQEPLVMYGIPAVFYSVIVALITYLICWLRQEPRI